MCVECFECVCVEWVFNVCVLSGFSVCVCVCVCVCVECVLSVFNVCVCVEGVFNVCVY